MLKIQVRQRKGKLIRSFNDMGDCLRWMRKSRGLTQKHASALLKWGSTRVGYVERNANKAPLKVLIELTWLYDFELKEFRLIPNK